MQGSAQTLLIQLVTVPNNKAITFLRYRHATLTLEYAQSLYGEGGKRGNIRTNAQKLSALQHRKLIAQRCRRKVGQLPVLEYYVLLLTSFRAHEVSLGIFSGTSLPARTGLCLTGLWRHRYVPRDSCIDHCEARSSFRCDQRHCTCHELHAFRL